MLLQKTKTIRNAYEGYLRSIDYHGYRDLWDCYARPSYAKERAYEYCENLRAQYNGHSATVTGFNCMMFTYCFIGEYEGKQAFFWITKDNDRCMILD